MTFQLKTGLVILCHHGLHIFKFVASAPPFQFLLLQYTILTDNF